MAPKKKSVPGSVAKETKRAKSVKKTTKSPARARLSGSAGVARRKAKPKKKVPTTSNTRSRAAKKPCGHCSGPTPATVKNTETSKNKPGIVPVKAARPVATISINRPVPAPSPVDRSRSLGVNHAEARNSLPEPTPAFLRQLREAVQTPHDSSTSFTASALPYSGPVGDEPQIFAANQVMNDQEHRAQALGPHFSKVPVHARLLFDAKDANVAILSSESALISSSEDSHVYSITVTYREPTNSSLGTPHVTVTWLPHSSALMCGGKDDSDDEPLIERVAARQVNARRNIAEAAATTAKDHEKPVPERRRSSMSRTPAALPRNNFYRRITPSRHKTPVNWLSNHRTNSTLRSTPTPYTHSLHNPTTVRRREQWNRAMDNMLQYNTRRLRFPRRHVFYGLVQDTNIILPRLEPFWKYMSGLVAEKKLFARDLFKHWEKLDSCTGMVNEKLSQTTRVGEIFEQVEDRAALGELGRRGMLWVAGGKVMLAKNALSTRRS